MDTTSTPSPEQSSAEAAALQLNLESDLLRTLVYALNGRASLTHIGKQLASQFAPVDISKALREGITAGTLGFEYRGGFREVPGLVFFPVTEAKSAAASKAANDVLVALVALLHHRSDHRGDGWRQATWDELQKTFGKSYSADAIVDGLRLGIQEGLVICAPRVEEKPTSPEYICFYLAEHLTHTVMTYDKLAGQGLCFHVRSGTPEAAVSKVQASAYGGPDLAILGVCAGVLPFRPATSAMTLPIETL
jgi:hypothetical protein